MQVENRQKEYDRDSRLEDVLKEVNGLLEPVERNLLLKYNIKK